AAWLVLHHDPDSMRVSARRPVDLPPDRERLRLRLVPGDYRARVHREGREPLDLQFSVHADSETRIEADLRSAGD
ncbi:MAG: hypothetical protein ACYTG4_02680, partial [Planctomycetota bacterium]